MSEVEKTTWDTMWMTHEHARKSITVMCPCIEIEFYLMETQRSVVIDFYDKLMSEVGHEFTHYQAENMKRPGPITDRARSMVATWLQNPKRTHSYWLAMYGGEDLGLNPLSFELRYYHLPLEEADRANRADFVRTFVARGFTPDAIPTSSLRLTVPIDHRFRDATQLVPWLSRLALLNEGPFLTGHCGYALNAEGFLGVTDERREALCLRYPGLAISAGGGRLSSLCVAARPNVEHVIPRIRRASWITILHRDSFDEVGGEAGLHAAFADVPEVQLRRLPQGMIVQAGLHPQLGDLAKGHSLPVLRKVAKVLRPIRAERFNSPPDNFWDTWFDLLDRDYATP